MHRMLMKLSPDQRTIELPGSATVKWVCLSMLMLHQ